MPAAGDSNPTRFIAKFQRNTPLPPYYLPLKKASFPLTALSRDLFGIYAESARMSKASCEAPGGLPPGQGAPERQLHVPGQPATPVELSDDEAPYSGIEVRVHGVFHSIADAMARGGDWVSARG